MTESVREGLGRREADQLLTEGILAKKVVAWIIGVGLALAFAGGVWAADTRGRIVNLETGQFTREEAAGLRNAVDLLRQEITYLRTDLNRLEQQR